MPSETMKFIWIAFWVLVAVGWSVLSFRWLQKNVSQINGAGGKKGALQKIVLRRVFLLTLIGVLLFLALKTEPAAAVAMALTITAATWIQVWLYHKQTSAATSLKENNLGSN